MNITQVMTERVVTVEMDDSLAVVKDIFDNVRFHHLLVIEHETLAGVISDRDLFRSISPYLGTPAENKRDAETLNRRAHQIMSRKPITLGSDATVANAIEVFKANRISCIPIVDDAGKPLGIVSWRDVINSL